MSNKPRLIDTFRDPKSGSWNLPGALRVENAWFGESSPGLQGVPKNPCGPPASRSRSSTPKAPIFGLFSHPPTYVGGWALHTVTPALDFSHPSGRDRSGRPNGCARGFGAVTRTVSAEQSGKPLKSTAFGSFAFPNSRIWVQASLLPANFARLAPRPSRVLTWRKPRRPPPITVGSFCLAARSLCPTSRCFCINFNSPHHPPVLPPPPERGL